MEAYASVLNFAIPGFVLLMSIEFVAGRFMGVNTIRSMDTISSLSSGFTNIIKDVLRLTIVLVSYKWLEGKIALVELPEGWWLYVITFIALDFASYWYHRMSHRVNYFWNQHIIHHSSEEYNLACALRQPISNIFGFYAILLIPIALLGVPPEVIALVAPIHLFSQFWYHTRLIKRMGFLEKIIMTPSHHRVHHAINPQYIDKNYSPIFIFWDKWFGTFQEELPEVPPIYGVKKQVNTWNPILINFQHLWQLMKDAWRAKNWWDKLRIWFMPTGWRPADVAEKYPIEILSGEEEYEKYDPPASMPLTIWAWAQLILNLGLMLYLFNSLSELETTDQLIYAGFLGTSVFAYTLLMDRNRNAWWVELIKFDIGMALLLNQGSWFGLGDKIPGGDFLILGYLILSLGVAIAFHVFEFRKDVTPALPPTTA